MAYWLGVDLGTSYTAAATTSREGDASIVTLGDRAPVLPSVVFLRDDGTMLVGVEAERRAAVQPERVAREFKRRIGDPTPLLLGGSPFAPEALQADLLRRVVAIVTERMGGAPTRIALTHPANWGPYKLDLLAETARLAGVVDPVTLTEPEAAAWYYASQQRVEPGETIAVYDLGGGTFDAAVLRRTPTGYELIGRPTGIEHLGGVDVDEAVMAHVRQSLGADFDDLDPSDPSVAAMAANLRRDCIDAKEALSNDTGRDRRRDVAVGRASGASHARRARVDDQSVARPHGRRTATCARQCRHRRRRLARGVARRRIVTHPSRRATRHRRARPTGGRRHPPEACGRIGCRARGRGFCWSSTAGTCACTGRAGGCRGTTTAASSGRCASTTTSAPGRAAGGRERTAAPPAWDRDPVLWPSRSSRESWARWCSFARRTPPRARSSSKRRTARGAIPSLLTCRNRHLIACRPRRRPPPR